MRERHSSPAVSEETSNEKTFSHTPVCQRQHICTGKKDLIEKILIKKSRKRYLKFVIITRIMANVECLEN